MIDIKSHCILHSRKISEAMFQLNELGSDLTLFVIKDDESLMGTVTDGDIRRGLLRKLTLEDPVKKVMESGFSFLRHGHFTTSDVEAIWKKKIFMVPVVDGESRIVKLLNLSKLRAILPIEAVLMAGGEGKRLRPLTEFTPKSLLVVGSKPVMEHTIDRLMEYGIENFWVCVGYRGDQIERHFNDGASKGISIKYIREEKPLGTIGAVRGITEFASNDVLIINSDILTTLNYQDFYLDFVKKDADLSVAVIPYLVTVPYGVLETKDERVVGLKEKPTYTYYSNAGIYLIRKKVLDLIPEGFFDATDFLEVLLQTGKRVIYYPMQNYWLDIGSPEDYRKANEDIKHLK